MAMQDFKRALYDFSAAIRAEVKSKKDREADKKELSKYYCKFQRLSDRFSGGRQVQSVPRAV